MKTVDEEPRAASETFEEQLDRLNLMADGDSQWDLSDNDRAAIKAVLVKLEAKTQERSKDISTWETLGEAPQLGDGVPSFGELVEQKIMLPQSKKH
jgi:hypothetical protein